MRIKIAGDYKWLSTIEFLREARHRCEYKLVSLANDARDAKWSGAIYTLADDTTGMGELYEWNFSERTTKDSRLDDFLLEPEDEDCVFDGDYEESEKQHYIKLMELFKLYLNTPTNKRGDGQVPLYLITVDGSFDDESLTIEVACDTRRRENCIERVSLFATEDNINEYDSLDHIDFLYLEHIVNAFEVPYIQQEYGNTTAHEVSNVTNFNYTLERINDYV